MHIHNFIHWDPDPSIFGLPFRWYGLLFASSFFFGYILMSRIFRKEGLSEKWLDSLTIYMAVSTVLGARLGHCFFYEPDYYLAHPAEILMVWKGGLASHGAAIGIITGLWLWSRKVSKRSMFWVLDRVVIMVALSGLTIRTGNLVNSEILGKPTTASYGFVFPQADQSESLRMKWEGEKVEVRYNPNPIAQARTFDFYRSTDDTHFTRINAQPLVVPPGKIQKGEAAKLIDQSPGSKAAIHYIAAEVGQKAPLVVPKDTSATARTAQFIDPFQTENLLFGGRWEGDQVHLRLDLRSFASQQATRGTLLLRKGEGDTWDLISRGVLGGNSRNLVLDTLDTPPAGTNPVYQLVVKEDESNLVARHPAQLYEAFAYTLIFLLLWGYYYKLDGKVPLGRLFGMFLVLVFGARFVLEMLKEEQTELLGSIPLNMGALLSIPFVLAGIVFIFLSFTKPVVDYDQKKN